MLYVHGGCKSVYVCSWVSQPTSQFSKNRQLNRIVIVIVFFNFFLFFLFSVYYYYYFTLYIHYNNAVFRMYFPNLNFKHVSHIIWLVMNLPTMFTYIHLLLCALGSASTIFFVSMNINIITNKLLIKFAEWKWSVIRDY